MKFFSPNFRNSLLNRSITAARQSWVGGGLSQQVTRTRLFLKKQLWVWPIIAVILLFGIGVFVQSAIEQTMKANLSAGLTAFRDLQAEMLISWLRVQESNAQAEANDLDVRQHIYELIKTDPSEKADAETLARIRNELTKEVSALLSSHAYDGYFVANRDHEIIASSDQELVGQKNVLEYDKFLDRIFDGEATVTPPFPSVVRMDTEQGELRTGQPVMYAAAPVRDDSFQVVGALALRIRPDEEFTRILQLGQVGETGETYAFNRDGMLVSNSRFDDELILLGLIPDEADSKSILRLLVRDPGGNMTTGYRPNQRRSKLPMTFMVRDAIAGNTGVNVDGYNDYRGVPVVGAWTWIPNYDIGVAVEVDVAQSYRPLFILKQTFWGLYTLLALAAIAIFIFTVIVAKLQRKAQAAAIEAQQLGQYTLEERIGSGAMGEVYKGFHSMLRRPTAVKLLNPEIVNDTSVARFEREVQITCKLNNPHTIAIYDYGRTPEGVFYYAMEYLSGIDLQKLVESYGPLNESRVLQILDQICSSLYEAHSLGLVHRDIKPANLMLNRRGGVPDVVKVLDFGLVKAVDDDKQFKMTTADSLTGTPLYMSPEAIQAPATVDARSDLYAVGAVGYYLLTGRPVFQARNLVELCNLHVTEAPVAPSEFTGETITDQLESALLSCLEKSPAKRPQTARDLSMLLRRSPLFQDWTFEDADAWWGKFERGIRPDRPSASQSSTKKQGEATSSAKDTSRTDSGDDDPPSSMDRTIIQ